MMAPETETKRTMNTAHYAHWPVGLPYSIATPETSRSLAGAIQTADEALYQAKREGRNRVCFKDSDGDIETGNFRVIQRDLA